MGIRNIQISQDFYTELRCIFFISVSGLSIWLRNKIKAYIVPKFNINHNSIHWYISHTSIQIRVIKMRFLVCFTWQGKAIVLAIKYLSYTIDPQGLSIQLKRGQIREYPPPQPSLLILFYDHFTRVWKTLQ